MSRSRLVKLALSVFALSLWACGMGVGESPLSATAATTTTGAADAGTADSGGGCHHH